MFQEIDDTSEKILEYIIEKHSVSSSDLYKKLFRSTGISLSSHLDFLLQEKLIERRYDGYIDFIYSPTPTGAVYFHIRNKNRLHSFYRSILAPMLVALLTTLLTLYLKEIAVK